MAFALVEEMQANGLEWSEVLVVLLRRPVSAALGGSRPVTSDMASQTVLN